MNLTWNRWCQPEDFMKMLVYGSQKVTLGRKSWKIKSAFEFETKVDLLKNLRNQTSCEFWGPSKILLKIGTINVISKKSTFKIVWTNFFKDNLKSSLSTSNKEKKRFSPLKIEQNVFIKAYKSF